MAYDPEKKMVCIIEDDDDIREIYSTELSNKGFEIVSATNGEEGINVIIQNRPDIILLDLQMPVMNGFEVMEYLQTHERFSRIPIIVLTNADDQHSISKAGEFETRFYVTKSLTTPQKIASLVREVLH